MDFNKKNIKAVRGLILFTAVVLLGVINIKEVILWIFFLIGIVKPFLVGGAMAFVVNIPMKAIEKHLFKKSKSSAAEKLKRPASLALALLSILLVIIFVVVTVVPQLTRTVMELGNQIPIFINDLFIKVEELFATNPEMLRQIEQLQEMQIDWNSIVGNIGVFLKNGVGNMVSSTFNVASSIVSGVVNVLIAFIFSLYILTQKEKLGDQSRRILSAYLPKAKKDWILKVMDLLHRNFSNFITGQCLEAVILGLMFFLIMSLLRFPYALLVGVLIAFTALIPIVGAFVGCFVGAFLIMIENPLMAVWFIVLFLILQQIEGNLIYPYVVGSSVGLPSIWVLAAVSVGGSLMGVIGMLVFIPLVSTAYALIKENVNERNKKRA